MAGRNRGHQARDACKHLKSAASPIYYLAGPPGMVGAMRTVLHGMRVDEGEIRDDPRVRRGGRVVPNNRNRQVPGGVYGVDPPSGVYINRANPTGEWNALVIEFRPPSLEPVDCQVIRSAARIKTVLNGQTMQDWTTGDMIFDVPTLIEFLSASTRLAAGTVILTGPVTSRA